MFSEIASIAKRSKKSRKRLCYRVFSELQALTERSKKLCKWLCYRVFGNLQILTKRSKKPRKRFCYRVFKDFQALTERSKKLYKWLCYRIFDRLQTVANGLKSRVNGFVIAFLGIARVDGGLLNGFVMPFVGCRSKRELYIIWKFMNFFGRKLAKIFSFGNKSLKSVYYFAVFCSWRAAFCS
ncbi:MAG: hypothetical protein NC299_02470 [Lachnospiraceae bacterium]|nr:hypothetical protein [Ruminococcus sp.]MCM1274214.1 hypothetical protein [Lachnospiraceae bacterium]